MPHSADGQLVLRRRSRSMDSCSCVRRTCATVSKTKGQLPGSWVPLALFLMIFCTRFVVRVSTALNSPIVGAVGFVGSVSVILGSCSGLFLSRAVRTLSLRHAVHA